MHFLWNMVWSLGWVAMLNDLDRHEGLDINETTTYYLEETRSGPQLCLGNSLCFLVSMEKDHTGYKDFDGMTKIWQNLLHSKNPDGKIKTRIMLPKWFCIRNFYTLMVYIRKYYQKRFHETWYSIQTHRKVIVVAVSLPDVAYIYKPALHWIIWDRKECQVSKSLGISENFDKVLEWYKKAGTKKTCQWVKKAVFRICSVVYFCWLHTKRIGFKNVICYNSGCDMSGIGT